MGLEQSDIDEVQKSWDIAKSAAKLRYRSNYVHIRQKCILFYLISPLQNIDFQTQIHFKKINAKVKNLLYATRNTFF